MNTRMNIVAAAGSLGLGAALMAGTAQAVEPFDATLNGLPNNSVIADLPPSSDLSLAVANLPAQAGLYGIHCAVPADPRGAPTRCDSAAGTAIFITPVGADRAEVVESITVNAEFIGSNPNRVSGDQGTDAIDCREQACAVYTLGSGREFVNPTYLRFFSTEFASVGPREDDAMKLRLRNKPVADNAVPRLRYGKDVRFTVRMTSGLTPTVTSTNCRVDLDTKTIRGLVRNGNCTVVVTTAGDTETAPFVSEQKFKIRDRSAKR